MSQSEVASSLRPKPAAEKNKSEQQQEDEHIEVVDTAEEDSVSKSKSQNLAQGDKIAAAAVQQLNHYARGLIMVQK